MTSREKALCGIVLFMAWAGLVFLDKTAVEPFVAAIQSTLCGLGIYHAALVDPKGKP